MRASDGVDAVRVISRSDEYDFFVTFLFSAAGVTPVLQQGFSEEEEEEEEGIIRHFQEIFI